MNELPWIEKYRPKKISEVLYQDEIGKMLQTTIKDGNLPHLLLHGPPGTGKTSMMLALSLELFGPRNFRERVLELNASNDRGINVMRDKVIPFAKSTISNSDPNYPSPPYKIIILDESDSLTIDSMNSLRKVIEEYSHITRFVFICNYPNKIIDAINSRCVKFRFKAISDEVVRIKLNDISLKEKLEINENALDLIIESSNGDLRRAITLLQNLKYMSDKITLEDLQDCLGYVGDDILDEIKEVCFVKEKNIKNIMDLSTKIIEFGYPIQNVLIQIVKLVVRSDKLKNIDKADISIHISNTEKNLIDGADEFIQILNLFVFINSKF